MEWFFPISAWNANSAAYTQSIFVSPHFPKRELDVTKWCRVAPSPTSYAVIHLPSFTMFHFHFLNIWKAAFLTNHMHACCQVAHLSHQHEETKVVCRNKSNGEGIFTFYSEHAKEILTDFKEAKATLKNGSKVKEQSSSLRWRNPSKQIHKMFKNVSIWRWKSRAAPSEGGTPSLSCSGEAETFTIKLGVVIIT